MPFKYAKCYSRNYQWWVCGHKHSGENHLKQIPVALDSADSAVSHNYSFHYCVQSCLTDQAEQLVLLDRAERRTHAIVHVSSPRWEGDVNCCWQYSDVVEQGLSVVEGKSASIFVNEQFV